MGLSSPHFPSSWAVPLLFSKHQSNTILVWQSQVTLCKWELHSSESLFGLQLKQTICRVILCEIRIIFTLKCSPDELKHIINFNYIVSVYASTKTKDCFCSKERVYLLANTCRKQFHYSWVTATCRENHFANKSCLHCKLYSYNYYLFIIRLSKVISAGYAGTL